jgi:hypothetical protein
VLLDGRLRWGRLENLFREGSKSQDYDPQQVRFVGGGPSGSGGAPRVEKGGKLHTAGWGRCRVRFRNSS